MDKYDEYIKSINKHSIIHLVLCVLTSILSVVFGVILEHWPLISTLTATSAISLVSGLVGRKVNNTTKKRLIKTFFVIQIVLLCAWDFGGVVCVITIILGYRKLSSGLFIAICVISCLSYISFFIYFWVSFSVINRLMILLNENKRKRNINHFLNKSNEYTPPEDESKSSSPSNQALYTARQMHENTFKVLS